MDFCSIKYLLDEREKRYHFPDAMCALLEIDDTGVVNALRVKFQEITILGNQHHSFTSSKVQMVRIIRLTQSNFLRARHFDSTPAESIRNGYRDMLVEIKADRFSHAIF